MNKITVNEWPAVMEAVARVMTENAERLCEMDALAPAAQAAEEAAQAGKDLPETARAALEGARRGLEATKEMVPKYGKAAVFAAKALGVEDQGAAAGTLLVQGLCEGVEQEARP